jgi:formylmethanofuran dehydrogenase subunit E
VLIPIGIRIGLDAQERLQAEPRGLSVLYHTGVKAPCPCIADGVMIATRASPGQGTLRIAAEQAAPGLYAMITVRNRKTGQGIRYTISDEWAARIIEWNRTLDPRGRYEAAVKAEGLFTVQPIP